MNKIVLLSLLLATNYNNAYAQDAELYNNKGEVVVVHNYNPATQSGNAECANHNPKNVIKVENGKFVCYQAKPAINK